MAPPPNPGTNQRSVNSGEMLAVALPPATPALAVCSKGSEASTLLHRERAARKENESELLALAARVSQLEQQECLVAKDVQRMQRQTRQVRTNTARDLMSHA